MGTGSCPLCGASAGTAFATAVATVSRCANPQCRHLFAASPASDQGVCAPDPTKDFSIYAERDRVLVRYWRELGFIVPGARVLDVGSGSGHVLAALLAADPTLRISAVEAGAGYHAGLRALGLREVYLALEQVPLTPAADAALLLEVIEHVPDPVATLQAIRARLKPGARLFLTTPAGDTRRPLPDPSRLATFHDREHVHYFTEFSLELAAAKAGFTHCEYRFIPQLYPRPRYSPWRMYGSRLLNRLRRAAGRTTHLTCFLT